MKSVKVTLNDDLETRLEVLKRKTGIQNYADIVRHLITEAVSPQEVLGHHVASAPQKFKVDQGTEQVHAV